MSMTTESRFFFFMHSYCKEKELDAPVLYEGHKRSSFIFTRIFILIFFFISLILGHTNLSYLDSPYLKLSYEVINNAFKCA